eukprot:11800364-Heterocapsa_arctica.AAC.1
MVSTISRDNGVSQPTAARKTSGNACLVSSLAAIGKQVHHRTPFNTVIKITRPCVIMRPKSILKSVYSLDEQGHEDLVHIRSSYTF